MMSIIRDRDFRESYFNSATPKVESVTGYDFFAYLSDDVEEAIGSLSLITHSEGGISQTPSSSVSSHSARRLYFCIFLQQ
ncbi:MAG: hypothetical protein QNJ55_11130 [Xenococcus sp. MO_188.B8]|nr:hypothetical protein [Xenococcus sp. MO_188.B8]